MASVVTPGGDSERQHRLDVAAYHFNRAMQSAPPDMEALLTRSHTSRTPLSQPDHQAFRRHLSSYSIDLNMDQATSNQCYDELLQWLDGFRNRPGPGSPKFFYEEEGRRLLLKRLEKRLDMSNLTGRLNVCRWLIQNIEGPHITSGLQDVAIFEFCNVQDRGLTNSVLYNTFYSTDFILQNHVISFDYLGRPDDDRYSYVLVQLKERTTSGIDQYSDKTIGLHEALCALVMDLSVVQISTFDQAPIRHALHKRTRA